MIGSGLSPAPVPPRGLVFDWDNTLIDSWDCLGAALNETLEAFGMAPWTREQVRARVARSLRESFPVLFGDQWEAAARIYHRAFERRHLEALRPLPGVEAMLDDLGALGLPLAVVSNKSGGFLRDEVAALGWEARFRALLGAGDAPRDKPDPAPVRAALAAMGLTAGPRIWFVGDTPLDMACARAADCTPVLLAAEPVDETALAGHPPALRLDTAAALAARMQDRVS